jgi:hypothetical protein
VVTLEEAREHWEAQLRRIDVYLAKSATLGRVAALELAEINRIGAEYQARLGGQPDPYTAFRKDQSRLLRITLERHGTPEGKAAYAEFHFNEAYPGERSN